MKIDNYSASLNAQYFNLSMSATDAQITHSEENFTNQESNAVEKVQAISSPNKRAEFELSKKLSAGVLKNLSGESRRLIRDRVEINSTYVEAQGLHFQAGAKVQADGKEYDVALDISLSRSFIQNTSITVDLVQKKMQDPLIISLDGGMPNLSSKTFSFDIDSDGEHEQISQLKKGNAFLALDKNANGVIDDGKELFGTQSGDGFADLKAYDDDNNGWIDENDAIFDKLRVWKKGEGKDELLALGEVGIGAIFLGSADTPFSIKSQTNETLGEIRKSGMVLFEDGRAGVISQVDLAVNVQNGTVEKQTKEDLQAFGEAKQNVSVLNLEQLYKKDDTSEGSMGNKKLDKLQSQLRELRKQLSQAQENEKASLQTQIGALFSQMMSMLEVELK